MSVDTDLPSPGPAERFVLKTLTHADVPTWYHVYSTLSHKTANAHSFSEGWGDTRFAPIRQADGAPVHTYYLASTRESAYMESVLHNVSLAPPGLLEVDSLRHFHLVKLALSPRLDYVSLHTHYLPALGLTRAMLIDSPTDRYAQTRAWAQAAYLQREAAQALGYGSRRNDEGRCLMLFKQRLPDPPFEVLEESPLSTPHLRAEVLALCRSLGIHEV